VLGNVLDATEQLLKSKQPMPFEVRSLRRAASRGEGYPLTD
jgi:hypothetical protein